MQKYSMIRTRNVRIVERAVVEFPSDDEALSAADDAHLKEGVIGYNGKMHPLTDNAEEHAPALFDVAWDIAKVGYKENTRITDGQTNLRLGYVYTTDLLELCDELAKLDPHWPPDRRVLLSALARLRETMFRLNTQVEKEESEYA